MAGRRGVPPERGHAPGITARSLAAAGGRITLKAWLFWIATIWLTLELLLGGFEDLTRGPAMIVTGDHVDTVVSSLGYPVYVLLFLGVLKILGAVVIIAPGLLRLKEWAYAGSFFQIMLAAMSIAIVGLGLENLIYPLMVMLVTLTSWALRPAARVHNY